MCIYIKTNIYNCWTYILDLAIYYRYARIFFIPLHKSEVAREGKYHP